MVLLLIAAVGVSTAWAGEGEGYFYAKDPKQIPDGSGKASLRIESVLPNDLDPRIDDVTVSLRVKHARTRDLVVKLKRPNFDYPGGDLSEPTARLITLTDRDTRGKHLGEGPCPDAAPTSTPPGFTTFDDAGAPLSVGSAPYAGLFAPTEALSGFNNYHHAPSTDPASPETWKLNVKDVRAGKAGTLRCAVLYLHRL